MSLLFKSLGLNFAAIDSNSGSGKIIDGPRSMGKEDIIDFLGEGDDDDKQDVIDLDPPKKQKAEKTDTKADVDEDTNDKADKPEKEDKQTGDDEEEEEEEEDDEEVERTLEDELEDDLQEVDKEKLQLVTPVRRSEILKKYPNVFKDFPYLEVAYYREQKFTEMFPTMEDAEESQAKATTLDRFETDLMDGNTENIFKGVKQSDAKAFAKMIDKLLPTLAEVDEKAYHHILGNVIKETIIGMVTEARAQKNDALQDAAALLNQYIFGSSTFVPPKKLVVETGLDKEDNPEKATLDRERREFAQQKFNDAKSSIDTRVANALKSTIEGNIDKTDDMTPYVKRNAIREASDQIKSLIEKDSRFKVIIDKLWERALKNGMKQQYIDEIRSTYLTKAKTLLPSVIKKARNEALKGMGKKVRAEKQDDNEVDVPPRNAKRKNNEDDESPRSRTSGKSKEVPKGMTTLEYLMDGD